MENFEEKYAEYCRQELLRFSTNALTDVEMIYADLSFAQFESDLKKAAEHHPLIQLRLAITKIERISQIKSKRPEAFDAADILARSERMSLLKGDAWSEEYKAFKETCQSKYYPS